MSLMPSKEWLETIRRQKLEPPRPAEPLHLVTLRTQPFQGVVRVLQIDTVLGVVVANISAGQPRVSSSKSCD